MVGVRGLNLELVEVKLILFIKLFILRFGFKYVGINFFILMYEFVYMILEIYYIIMIF